MADVYFSVSYRLDLTDDEIKIICLALAGKIKTLEQRKDAHKLNLKLLNAQKTRLSEQARLIEGALQKALEEVPIHDKETANE